MTPETWGRWLTAHQAATPELLVGFYKRGSGRPSITWPESVDEALCYGWIDGVRRRVDDLRYTIRFTPRRRGSIWSAVNVKRAAELTALGRMRPAGMRAFEHRVGAKTEIYSYEQRMAPKLTPAYEKQFRANAAAWTFFQSHPPWYQRTATWWVVSAKREETRLKRLATLITDCGAGRTIAQLRRTPKGS